MKIYTKISLCCLALMSAAASSFLFSARLFASDMDDRIESTAKQPYVFKAYLKDDDIQIHSKNGDVALTGTVSGETDKSLARETIVSLPGVKSVGNTMRVAASTAD